MNSARPPIDTNASSSSRLLQYVPTLALATSRALLTALGATWHAPVSMVAPRLDGGVPLPVLAARVLPPLAHVLTSYRPCSWSSSDLRLTFQLSSPLTFDLSYLPCLP